MLKNRNTEMGRSRKGAIAVLVAVLLVVLVGMLALVLDGGLLQDNRREVQSAADAAALAAASKLFTNYTLITGKDGDDPTAYSRSREHHRKGTGVELS